MKNINQKTDFLHAFNIVPNSVQQHYWNDAGNHSILLAPTGSGKTLAFLVKALEVNQFPLLVISPTRELVLQLAENFKRFLPTHSTVSCYGGHSVENESNQLLNSPSVVITTVGRLMDHLRRKTFRLSNFQQLIIDEYDKLLELNFRAEIDQILDGKTWNFIQLSSATSLADNETILQKINWKIIDLQEHQQPRIDFFKLVVSESEKVDELIALLQRHKSERIIVFCSHREACERIYDHLYDARISTAIYHGGLKQSERERAYIKFNHQSERILVCTDLAARGLDLPQVDMVIHYQTALDEASQTHRNGRTGRNGKHGNVVYFATNPDEFDFPTIQTLTLKKNNDFVQRTTLYINAGRKQKLRKIDFIGFFCKEMNVPNDVITAIAIFDSYTYITLLHTDFLAIKDKLKNIKIKKERVLVRVCY